MHCSLPGSPSSVEFSRQEDWSRLPFPSPGDPPNSGIKPTSPALQADSSLSEPPGKPVHLSVLLKNIFIHLFIFGCAGSSLLHGLFSSCNEQGLLFSYSAQASRLLWWLLLLRRMGSRAGQASVVIAHGPSCSVICGIFLDQGSNPCPLHW